MEFIMKRFTIFLIFAVFLCGCSKKTPVETAFDDVQQSAVEIKQSLPQGCKTELVESKFAELEAKQEVAKSVCETKIKDVQTKYERVLAVLILLILGIFVKFFIKK